VNCKCRETKTMYHPAMTWSCWGKQCGTYGLAILAITPPPHPVPNIPRPYRDKNTFSFHTLFKSPPIINLPSDGTTPDTMTALCNRHAVCPLTPTVCLPQSRGTVVVMRSALFWVVTQRVVVNRHRCFGTTYRSHLWVSRNIKSSTDLIYIAKEAWNQWLWCSPLQPEAPRLGLRIQRHKSRATIGICREKGCT
jgi:hypothetical protein